MKHTIKVLVGLSLVLQFACVSSEQSSLSTVSLAPPPPVLEEGKTAEVLPHPNPSSLLASQDSELTANKKLVFDLWRTVFNAGHVEEAGRFISEDYVEHNLTGLTGLEGFKQYYQSRVSYSAEIPETITDPVVTIIAEKDYVVVATVAHYYEPDDSGETYTSSHFDLFRIEEGLVAEHWDSTQVLPGDIPATVAEGGAEAIVGVEGLAQYALLESDDYRLANNKRLAFDLWRHTSESGREEAALLYLDPIYIQHNPNAATGREGFMGYFSQRPETPIEMSLENPLIAVVAEGDLVVQALKGVRPDPNNPGEDLVIAWFDMFRVHEGLLIEHWDTASKGEVPKIMQETFTQGPE